MKIPGGNRQLERGVSLVEILVAGLLLCIGIMALVQVWLFAFRVTVNTDDKSIAYNLGRQAMERQKMAGFYNAVEGTATTYYNGSQNLLGSSTGARFTVVTTVTTTTTSTSNRAKRVVTVSVRNTATNELLYTSSTMLLRGGI